jgi:hypothetical protein
MKISACWLSGSVLHPKCYGHMREHLNPIAIGKLYFRSCCRRAFVLARGEPLVEISDALTS